MIRKLSFGQYIHKLSVVHSLDPRLKIICVLLISILIFFIDDVKKILIFSFLIAIIILLSKIEIKHFIKNLRPFLFIFIFIFVMYLLFSRNRLYQGLITIWRFLMLIIISLILTFTTTIASLVTAIERLVKPLKIVNIKPRNIAIMISITVRFIPVMFLNLEKLREAMLSRLANFRKLKYIKLIIFALLERMFKSASNLSDAMQSRLYNENVESYKTLKFEKYDYASIIFILISIYLLFIY